MRTIVGMAMVAGVRMGRQRSVWDWLTGRTGSGRRGSGAGRRRVLRRQVRVSEAAVGFVHGPACSDEDRMAFAELLLRLDADPFEHSRPVLPARPPGLRWAAFGAHKALFV